MLFFFKERPIVIDCLTSNVATYEHAKITEANNFYPEWWKAIPKKVTVEGNFFPSPTMKTCPGFIDLYSRGFMVPMWSELAIEVGQENTSHARWQFADKISTADTHPPFQHQGSFLNPNKFFHLKIHSGWIMQSKQKINMLMIQPFWNSDPSNIFVAPGVMPVGKGMTLNVNMFFKRQEQMSVYNLEFKQPVVHLLPQTNKKVKLNFELVSEQDARNIVKAANPKVTFINRFVKANNFKYGK